MSHPTQRRIHTLVAVDWNGEVALHVVPPKELEWHIQIKKGSHAARLHAHEAGRKLYKIRKTERPVGR